MYPGSERPSPKTSDEVRHAIDRGETGDKVPFPDPAAAPLGTDDEAAGRPPSLESLDITFASELRRPVKHRHGNGNWAPTAVAVVAFIAAIAIVLVAAMA